MFFYPFETIQQTTMTKIWNIVNTAKPEDWWRENNKVEWRLSLPYDTFVDDPKSNCLIQRFVSPHRLYVQRLEPRTSYNWHLDYARTVSICMCLNELKDSFTLFANKQTDNDPFHWFNLEPLYYEENTVYLIDGQLPHTGINLSYNTRYLVSISLNGYVTLSSIIKYLNQKF